jgi:hypothetical protein
MPFPIHSGSIQRSSSHQTSPWPIAAAQPTTLLAAHPRQARQDEYADPYSSSNCDRSGDIAKRSPARRTFDTAEHVLVGVAGGLAGRESERTAVTRPSISVAAFFLATTMPSAATQAFASKPSLARPIPRPVARAALASASAYSPRQSHAAASRSFSETFC